MRIKKRIAKYLSGIPFIYNSVSECADLSAFMVKPERRIVIRNIIGLSLILFSYVIGWPLIILIGILSLSFKKPLIAVIGAPAAYILSHLVFLSGMLLTGAYYTKIFMKWAVRKAVETFIGKDEFLN